MDFVIFDPSARLLGLLMSLIMISPVGIVDVLNHDEQDLVTVFKYYSLGLFFKILSC